MKCKLCDSILEIKELKDEIFYKCPKCDTAFTVPKDYYDKKEIKE